MKKLGLFIFTSLFLSMSTLIVKGETVVEIIVNSPDHNTLEAAVIAAELADDLSGEGPFTVFAPTDAAFAALPAGVLDALLADPTGDLADILLYHVLSGSVMSGDLSDGMTATTLLGKDIAVTINMDGIFINDAEVIIADIEADNGVVHVLDAVLIPFAPSAFFSFVESTGMEVYPNPATGYVNLVIRDDRFNKSRVSIINAAGLKVTEFVIEDQTYSLDITGLDVGIYNMVITSNELGFTEKLIVQ